tara:strand:+ start:1620 stop:1862 length:243 start_codon:yes stop_codon:yes gene_type:complete
MENNQLHLNDEMQKIVELIINMIFVTFNEKDFGFIIDLIKDNLDIEDSDSDSDVWSESDEDELTNDEIDYLNNINNLILS